MKHYTFETRKEMDESGIDFKPGDTIKINKPEYQSLGVFYEVIGPDDERYESFKKVAEGDL